MVWNPNFRKGVDLPIWEQLPALPDRISYHGTANAYDGVRFMYWVVQHGTTAASASTTTLWRFDTWTEGWQYLATATSGAQGMDLEYDAVRNVLYLIHGASLTSWQVFNLNTTAVVIANVTCNPFVLTTMTPVLPAASSYGASLTMPDDLSVAGPLTADGAVDIDTGTAAATGNTTTVVSATTATGTFGPGMVGLIMRVLTGAQAGQKRVISAVTNKNTLTLSVALPGALADGDTFSVEVPEHTVSAATTTTLTNSTNATWATNLYANSDVIMITGALAGQRRRIASNTADTLTLAAAVTGNPRTGAFTGTPAVNDLFRIVPSSDFLYYQAGGATGWYRIDVNQTTGVAWTTMAAMPAASGGGGNTFYPGSYAPFQILSLRGSATATLYAYNTGLNTWTTLTTFMGAETFTTGASATMLSGLRKIAIQKENGTRIYALDLLTGILETLGVVPYANPGGYDGKRLKFVRTEDDVLWLYAIRGGGQEFFRTALEQYA